MMTTYQQTLRALFWLALCALLLSPVFHSWQMFFGGVIGFVGLFFGIWVEEQKRGKGVR